MRIQLAILLSAISIFLIPVESYRTAPVSIAHYRRRLDKYRHYRSGGVFRNRVVRGPGYVGHANFHRKLPIGVKVIHAGFRRRALNPWYVSKISRQISRLPYIPPPRCAKNLILACSEHKRGDFKRKCFGKCYGKPCIKTCGCACLHRKDFLPKRVHVKSNLLPINRQSLIPFCRSRQVLRCTPRSFHLPISKVKCSHACSAGVCPTSCKCQCIAEKHVGVGLQGNVVVVGQRHGVAGISTAGMNGLSLGGNGLSLGGNGLSLGGNGIALGGNGIALGGNEIALGGEIGLAGASVDGIGVMGIGGNINGMLQEVGINSLDAGSLDGLGLGGLDTGGLDLNGFGVGSSAIGIASDGLGLESPDLSFPSLDVPDLGVPSLDSGVGLGIDEVLDFPSLDNGVGMALADGFVGVGGGVIGVAGGAGGGAGGHGAGRKRKGNGKKEITETVDVKINVTTNGNKKGKSKGGKHSGGADFGMGIASHGGGIGGINIGGQGGLFPGSDLGLGPGGGGQAPGTFSNGRKVGVIAGGNNGGLNDAIFISDPTQPKQFPKEPLPLIPGSGTTAVGLNQGGGGGGGVGGPADTLLNIPDLGADLAALNGVDALGGIPLNAQGKGPALPDLQFGAGSDPGLGMAGGLDLTIGGGAGAGGPGDFGAGGGGGGGHNALLNGHDFGAGGGGGHNAPLNGHDFGAGGGGGHNAPLNGHDFGAGGGGHNALLNDAVCSQTGEKLWCDVNSKWGNTPGLLQWCNTNCPTGSCDHERCSCYCVPPSVYDSNLVKITSFK